MPRVRVVEHSDLAPEVVLASGRDFSERRADMWPDVHVEYLQVHELGDDYAEVTEGNPWPIGHVWERLRYDWSQPDALLTTAIDSNLFKPGSMWERWRCPRKAAVGWKFAQCVGCGAAGGCWRPSSSRFRLSPPRRRCEHT